MFWLNLVKGFFSVIVKMKYNSFMKYIFVYSCRKVEGNLCSLQRSRSIVYSNHLNLRGSQGFGFSRTRLFWSDQDPVFLKMIGQRSGQTSRLIISYPRVGSGSGFLVDGSGSSKFQPGSATVLREVAGNCSIHGKITELISY